MKVTHTVVDVILPTKHISTVAFDILWKLVHHTLTVPCKYSASVYHEISGMSSVSAVKTLL